jgi:hypothetical protein
MGGGDVHRGRGPPTSAKLERAYPRAEPYELRLTRTPQLTLTVVRSGQLYDGPLLVRFFLKGAPPDRGGSVVTAYPQTWWTSVSGLISLPLPSVATYTVEVRTAEEEPAHATGDTTIDASEPTVMRVTLDLRIPDPAAPDAACSWEVGAAGRALAPPASGAGPLARPGRVSYAVVHA